LAYIIVGDSMRIFVAGWWVYLH